MITFIQMHKCMSLNFIVSFTYYTIFSFFIHIVRISTNFKFWFHIRHMYALYKWKLKFYYNWLICVKKWCVQLYCSLIETPSATYYIFSCQIMIMFISVIIIYISCIWEFWGPLWSYGSWIYLCNQCLSPLTLWVRIPLGRGVLDTTLCDKVCQWLVSGRWFSPGTTDSSTNKTYRHDIALKLLTVALNTITLTPIWEFSLCQS